MPSVWVLIQDKNCTLCQSAYILTCKIVRRQWGGKRKKRKSRGITRHVRIRILSARRTAFARFVSHIVATAEKTCIWQMGTNVAHVLWSWYLVPKNFVSWFAPLLQPWDLLSLVLSRPPFQRPVSPCAVSLLPALLHSALPTAAASPLPAAASRTKCPHQPKLNTDKTYLWEIRLCVASNQCWWNTQTKLKPHTSHFLNVYKLK